MEFYPFLKKGMEWVLSESVDGLPYGYGALEIGGFDCMVFDCAVDAVRGYEVLAKLAAELGFSDDAAVFISSLKKVFPASTGCSGWRTKAGMPTWRGPGKKFWNGPAHGKFL